jgi:hypothetical protein
MERPFENEDIVVALKDTNGDKAPGPNWFSVAFIKHHWGILESDCWFSMNLMICAGLRVL